MNGDIYEGLPDAGVFDISKDYSKYNQVAI